MITIRSKTAKELAAEAKTAKNKADTDSAKADVQLAAFIELSPAQAAKWVDDNVSNVTDVKVALKIMAKAICVMARKL